MDGIYHVPSFKEYLILIKWLEIHHNRKFGLYIETKSPTHFKKYNLSMEEKMLSLLKEYSLDRTDGSVLIQSFETQNLLFIKNISNIPLIQLIAGRDNIQSDSGLPFSHLITKEGTYIHTII